MEALTGDSFATDFDWGRFDRVFDVSGSKGSKSVAILKRHPHLKALVFDREQVVNTAKACWAGKESSELVDRLAFEAVDLLSFIPPATSDRDIYLLCAVLHGMDDDSCVRALRHLARAIGSTGARGNEELIAGQAQHLKWPMSVCMAWVNAASSWACWVGVSAEPALARVTAWFRSAARSLFWWTPSTNAIARTQDHAPGFLPWTLDLPP